MNKSRPKISVYIAMSIDGYIARENGDLDWLENIPSNSNEDYGFKDFMNSVDVLILGRNTYDVVSKFDKWPYKEKRVIVISKRLKNTRKEAELFSGDIHQLIYKLHIEGIKHIYVDGGITISKFLNAKMVDQIIITVIPIILGNGIRLFNPIIAEQNCNLISTQSYSNGLVQLRYELSK